MHELVKAHYDVLGPQVVKALEKNLFEAYYCSTSQETIDKALELIPKTDAIAWGGSVTIDTLRLKDILRERGNILYDRDHCPKEEVEELMRKGFFADTFLMSSNAVTEDGHLYNVDGNGNRVAALCFGPKQVLVIAGMNKVVRTVEDARERVRCIAAPANARRLHKDTPCFATAECVHCTKEETICADEVMTRVSHPGKRIKVILVGEDLGL